MYGQIMVCMDKCHVVICDVYINMVCVCTFTHKVTVGLCVTKFYKNKKLAIEISGFALELPQTCHIQ